MSTCARYRKSVPAPTRYAGVAGLLNTGTHFLYELLRRNCDMKGLGKVHWEVPWSKHTPLGLRDYLRYSKFSGKFKQVLPVTMVKDPLTWMKSMCRNPYMVQFHGIRSKSCPSLPVAATNVTVNWSNVDGKARTLTYPSLVHLWSDWYQAYVDADIPRLMVRYEDLLFDTERTVGAICSCVGGKALTARFHGITERAKKQWYDNSSDRAGALAMYSSSEYRLGGYTPADLDFVRTTAGDLARQFGYDSFD
mmetsp:Transcript_6976/g.19752  ORF Transcript_6976/g.19752 Transcript_6976/m.19752 type:complete len:250 (+) Transcript_6976:33-782(+)